MILNPHIHFFLIKYNQIIEYFILKTIMKGKAE
jgi:hypothetical protein